MVATVGPASADEKRDDGDDDFDGDGAAADLGAVHGDGVAP